jgi:MGT family glycosyltransferase
MIAIGRALCEHRHEVTIVTGEAYRDQLHRAGLGFLPLDFPPDELADSLAAFSKPLPRFPQIIWDRPQKAFFARLAPLTAQLVAIFQTLVPDVVLTDYNFYAGSIAAEVCGIPYGTFCAIVNALPSRDTPTFGAEMGWVPPRHPLRLVWHLARWISRWYLGWDDRVINQVRRGYGLPPVDFPIWYPSPYLFIVPTTDAYEYPRRDLIPQAVYVGPVTTPHRGDAQNNFPWEWLADDRPTIYVSLGTIVKLTQVFRYVIDLADGANWKAVLAVGQGTDLNQFGKIPENVLLRNYVPQYELLPKVDAVISHGGNNTVTEALMNGKPLVVIPITGDQPESAGRVVKARAGVRLNIRRLTPEKLGKAIQQVLYDPTFRAGAERIQVSYTRCQGAETIVALLERLAKERTPLHRPAGMSPTLYQLDEIDKLVNEQAPV